MQENVFNNIKVIFDPESIAIIGASNDASKPGGTPVVSLISNRYSGPIYTVNPKYKEIRGLPCFPSIEAIPHEVELALIALPSKMVLTVLKECVAKKVKAVIILTSGFSEVGDEGKKMQEEMREIIRKSGILMCGPNSQGIFNSLNGMSAGFGISGFHENLPVPNYFGFISQSGGFGTATHLMSAETGIGFTYFVSSGNEAGLEFSDYLAYMAKDQNTKVICGYLEGVKDGSKLRLAADMALQENKPLILIKAGRHEAAARAASSHTGSLVGSDRVYSSFFHQKAIIRVEGTEELNTILSFFVSNKLPGGNRVAILTTSGGSGVMLSDKCAAAGLDVVPLSVDTRQKLDAILPSYGSSANPVDATSQIVIEPDLLLKSIKLVIDDPIVDMLLIEHWPSGGVNKLLKNIIEVGSKSDKPIMVYMLGSEMLGQNEMLHLRKHMIPASRTQERAADALGLVTRYCIRARKVKAANKMKALNFNPDRDIVGRLLEDIRPGESLLESQSKQALEAYGIPCAREGLAKNPEEAAVIADRTGYPVVLKIDSPDIQHKTEVKGLRLNLNTPDDVRRAYNEIIDNVKSRRPEAKINGIMVQEMLKGGTECLVGISHDQTFGATVVFGLGGIFVEVMEDVSLRVCPVTQFDAREMIEEIKGYRILRGFRGDTPKDMEAISDVILKVSQLAMDFPQIKEMDINPLMVFDEGNGARVADALIVCG